MVIHAEDKFEARRKAAELSRNPPPVPLVDDKNALIAARMQAMLEDSKK